MTAWLEKVRHGDFSAIPRPVTFEEASELALLIDGYDITWGVAECFAIGRRVAEEICSTGHSSASALDLWIALFAHQRMIRFGGYSPTDEEEAIVGQLVGFLRLALLALPPKSKAGIMSLIRAPALTP